MRSLKVVWVVLALLTAPRVLFAGDAGASEDARIRKVVEEMLHAKDQKISDLEARMKELEQLTKGQQEMIEQLRAEKPKSPPALAQAPDKTQEAGKAPASNAVASAKQTSILEKFLPINKKDAAAVAKEEDRGPTVGGFMDVTAQTNSSDDQPFHLGVVELDLDRVVSSEHFAVSAALDWFPYGTSPNAQIGAGFVDFHLYDESVPVRGRIFQEPGFHVQAGQFDLPFSSDYQFFASRDRLTVTPPITTVRIEQSGVNPSNGGFNSTGVRTYGNWNHLSYAAYYTDSVYSSGSAVGGRLGFFMNDPYRLHKRSNLPIVDVGISALLDMDNSEHATNRVYAADLSFNYGSFRLLSEFMLRDADQELIVGNAALDEYAYHITLIANLEEWLKRSLYMYGRYEEWNPRYDFLEVDGVNYAVKQSIPALTVGLGYHLNDYLLLKLEYTNTLGHQTEEPDFQKQLGIAQLVASF